jgi:hypothetical protein
MRPAVVHFPAELFGDGPLEDFLQLEATVIATDRDPPG